MNPFGLHLLDLNFPVHFFQVPDWSSQYTGSDNYINQADQYKNMETDKNESIEVENNENESGKYVNLNKWTLLDINRKTDSRGRIHVNESNFGKEIRVFVSDIDLQLETCEKYALLPYPTYREILKSRAKDHAGELLKVQNNGDVWTGSTNKNKHVKIFVKANEQ
jgi:hypothetical protein